ncbi:MAG: hypothetical protein ACK6CU_04785 [Deltaproteobacteria bacterium]|jgi:hypothetical protein
MEHGTHHPLVVYTIVERQKDRKKLWVRIGTASRNRDGSLNAMLDAIPTNGSLHIRELRALSAAEPRAHEAAAL